MRTVIMHVPYGATDAVISDMNGAARIAKRGYRLRLILVERRGDMRKVTLHSDVLDDVKARAVSSILSHAITATSATHGDTGASGSANWISSHGAGALIGSEYVDDVLMSMHSALTEYGEYHSQELQVA